MKADSSMSIDEYIQGVAVWAVLSEKHITVVYKVAGIKSEIW